MRIAESELIINGDGSIFHLHIRPEQLADKVVLVGDPGRVSMFKPIFDAIECEGSSREFVWATGTYKGTKVTVMGSGMGMPSCGIYVFELIYYYNVQKIIRIGTCGVVSPEVEIPEI